MEPIRLESPEVEPGMCVNVPVCVFSALNDSILPLGLRIPTLNSSAKH